MVSKTPDTILICAANSAGRDKLRLDIEVESIAEALRRRPRKRFSIEQRWAVGSAVLRRAVLDHNPKYIHFCGHGTGPDGLVMDGRLVTGEALAELCQLFSSTLKCVFLNACFSEFQAEVLSRRIDYVIGMKQAIGDETAIEFSTAFYEAIGAGESIEMAFDYARAAIRLANLPDHLIPRLFSPSDRQSAGAEELLSSSITKDYAHHTRSWPEDWYTRALSIPRPRSIEGLQKLDSNEFQLYALLVVASMYKQAGLTFPLAPFSKDQERVGEAEVVLGIGLDQQFQITFQVWLEVKKRESESIGKGDIGVHLVDASFGKAHTIFFVTNSQFAAPLRAWLSDYVKQTGIQCKLINGQDLLRLSRHYVDKKPLTRAGTAAVVRGGRTPSVDATCWFSLSPVDQRTRMSSHHVIARTGRLLYLNVELSVGEKSPPFAGRLMLKTPFPAADCQPYPPTQADEHFFAPGDSITLTYSIWPGPLRNLSPSDFALSIESDVDVRLETTFTNSFDREFLSLPDVPLGSQMSAYAALSEHVSAKIDAHEGSLTLLLGPAGVGKSHVLSRLRRHFAGYGVRELYIDCDSVQNDRALFERVVRELLPLPQFALDADVRDAVIAWGTALHLSNSSARRIADDICGCGNESAMLTPRDRAELLAEVLGENADSRRLVVIVEDLHKAAPSLISLLLDVFTTVEMTGHGKVHFVLSSRPYSADISEVRNTWLARLGALSHARAAMVFTIAQPSNHDAEELLSAAVRGFEQHHIEALINAVGTSPYDLRECLLYLLRRNALRLGSNDNAAPPLEVANPLRLRLVLHSPNLRQATEERLKVLLSNQPAWLRIFLLAGAAYGRSFPLNAAVKAAAVDESSVGFDASLAECGLWSVAALSNENPDWIEFDHDLIRDALLQVGPPRTTRRAAGALYAQLPANSGDALRARIAYQAGMAAVALEHAKTAAQEAKAAERLEDVVELNQLRVQILDPNLSSIVVEDPASDDVFRLDAGIRYALPSRLPDLSPTEIHRSVLDLLVDNLSCLASTGSGSSVLSEKILSEAFALTERLADSKTKARLLSMEGRLQCERDHVAEALALHQSAEELFRTLEVDRDHARAENFIRLAICERLLGHIEESIRYLGCAMRTCERRDWSVLNKIRNNLGALYLKSDWKAVRYHWNKQIAHAERHALFSRVAHGLLSLGFVDLFEGDLKAGFERTERGRGIAERLHIDNQRVRAALNLSVYYVNKKSYPEALDWLREGEKVALRHHIGRRLWRVIANMAVVYELLGQSDLCSIREAQVAELLQSSQNESIGGRQVLPLVNVALRARSDLHIPRKAYEYAELVRAGHRDQLPNLLGNYCLDLPLGPRFLLTE